MAFFRIEFLNGSRPRLSEGTLIQIHCTEAKITLTCVRPHSEGRQT